MISQIVAESRLTLGKVKKPTHPVKYHCVDCNAALVTRGKSKKWRETKDKRCQPCAAKHRLKGAVHRSNHDYSKDSKVETIKSTRVLVKHINDGKALQRQINELDSRVVVLEREIPRKTVGEREIDVPDHLYKSYHALKAIGGKATAHEVCVRSGRARAAESSDLNVLATMGIVNKFHNGRKVIFELRHLECAQV